VVVIFLRAVNPKVPDSYLKIYLNKFLEFSLQKWRSVFTFYPYDEYMVIKIAEVFCWATDFQILTKFYKKKFLKSWSYNKNNFSKKRLNFTDFDSLLR